MVVETFKNIFQLMKEETRQKVLDWLSRDDAHQTFQKLRNAKVESTGVWFFQTKEVKDWLNGRGPNFLYCPGKGNRISFSNAKYYI